MAAALGAVHLRERDGPPGRVVLDLDGTDEPARPAAGRRRLARRPGGATEGRVKGLKRGCAADRLSCHRFWANRCRLLLHAAAHWLLDTLRRWLVRAEAARAELAALRLRLRLRLLKVVGGVRQHPTCIRLRLANDHPDAHHSGTCSLPASPGR